MGEFIFLALLIFLAFYIILLRPVIQQQKRRKRDVSSLDIGDEVMTTGGFYAVITAIKTQDKGPLELTLEVAPGVHLRGTAEAVAFVSKRAADVSPADRGELPGGTGKAGAH